jgi:hypothetical protein
VPDTKIDSIKPSPIAGYKEVAIGGQVVYVSTDGKYLTAGLADRPGRARKTSPTPARP